jgi:hypothetical protein
MANFTRRIKKSPAVIVAFEATFLPALFTSFFASLYD